MLTVKFLSFVALASLACAPLAERGMAQASSPLIASLLAALNSKDTAKLQEFLVKNASTDVPLEDRLSRMKQFVERGAPFKVVQSLPERNGAQSAIISDRGGMKLRLTINLAGPKIKSMMVVPADEEEGPAPKDYAGWTSLSSLNQSIRSDTNDPAMGTAVLRNGKFEEVAAGVRTVGTKESVGVGEAWSIGSIGKPLCSTLIGRLIERGKLRWDTTLGEALPDLAMKPEHKLITLDQLMHHRAGIPADGGMRKPQVERIVAGQTDPTKIRLNYARDILSRDLIAKPGSRFEYSNAGYVLLGVIAERVTGKRYEQLVRELIFTPLGLKSSYTGADRPPTARPVGHSRGPNGLRPGNFTGPLEVLFAPAGGGMYMSVGDLVKFGNEHLKGLQGHDGLLKASTIKRLHSGHREESGGDREYACGWGIERHPGLELMHTHNGSNGTMRAQLAIFPGANLVIASAVNAGGESEPSPPLQMVLAVAAKYAPNRR